MSECSSCNEIKSPDNSVEVLCYASLDQAQSGCVPTSSNLAGESEETCRPQQLSTTTDGGDATKFTNSREAISLTLLGRIGNRLAKFVGSGFIQVEDGEAKLVSFIPLKIRELYHRWVIPSPGQSAVLGAAKPAPYMVISDNDGKTYAIKGLAGEDCIILWDFVAKAFVTKPLTDFPVSVKGALQKRDKIEIAGFQPPSSACYDKAREVMALKGAGIVFLTNETVEYPDSMCCDDTCGSDCKCDDNKIISVASVVLYPDDSSTKQYILAWQFGAPPVFIEKPAASSGEKGDPGAKGDQGVQGIQGTLGVKGDTGEACAKGDKGDAGEQGEAGNVGDITVTPTVVLVDAAIFIQAPLTGGQDVNGAGSDVNFGANVRAEGDWSHISGTPNFILGASAADYNHVEITAHIQFDYGNAGGATPVLPVLELYKAGALVAEATVQHGYIDDDAGKNSEIGSNTVVFTDLGALVAGVSYKVRTQRGNDNTDPVAGVAGHITLKAVKRVSVVTEIELSTP